MFVSEKSHDIIDNIIKRQKYNINKVDDKRFNFLVEMLMYAPMVPEENSCKYTESIIEIIKGGVSNNVIVLTLASVYCHPTIIKELINHGANIYDICTDGNTILRYALCNNNPEASKIIKEQMIKDFKFIPLGNDIIRHIIEEYI